MVGIQTRESELEIYRRKFEKRVGYARVVPLVTVATLNRVAQLCRYAIQYLILVMMAGKFWLLRSECFTVNVLRG